MGLKLYFCRLNPIIMSQRLQSVFFFLSSLLFAMLFFMPMAEYFGETNILQFDVFGVESMLPHGDVPFKSSFSLPVLVMTVTALLLSLYLSLGLFRAVKLSHFMRLYRVALIDIVVIVAWIAVVFGYYIRVVGHPIGAETEFMLGAFLPLPALLLTIAATMGLKKDIKRVRSTDRIR